MSSSVANWRIRVAHHSRRICVLRTLDQVAQMGDDSRTKRGPVLTEAIGQLPVYSPKRLRSDLPVLLSVEPTRDRR